MQLLALLLLLLPLGTFSRILWLDSVIGFSHCTQLLHLVLHCWASTIPVAILALVPPQPNRNLLRICTIFSVLQTDQLPQHEVRKGCPDNVAFVSKRGKYLVERLQLVVGPLNRQHKTINIAFANTSV